MSKGVSNATLNIYSAKLGATPEYQAVASGLSISVNVAADAGAVGTITASPITITGGANFASTEFHAVGVGSTNITASSVGYTPDQLLRRFICRNWWWAAASRSASTSSRTLR